MTNRYILHRLLIAILWSITLLVSIIVAFVLLLVTSLLMSIITPILFAVDKLGLEILDRMADRLQTTIEKWVVGPEGDEAASKKNI